MMEKNRKGQMKIQQMVFMLIAVTLFLVLAGLFFLLIVFSGTKESAALLEEENALLLVSKLANSPEFSCGDVFFGTTKTNCIDSDKVMALKDNINLYPGFWGVDGIKIKKIYPENVEVCDFENYPSCGEINLFSNQGTGVSNFVALCRKENIEGQIYDKCDMAEIIVYYGAEQK